MTDLVQDLTPQLGGPLDTNDKIITNNAEANVVIQGNTSVSASAGVKLGGQSTYVFVQLIYPRILFSSPTTYFDCSRCISFIYLFYIHIWIQF